VISVLLKSEQKSGQDRIYFSETLSDLSKVDIFPKDFVPPRGIQSDFYKRLRTATRLEEANLIVVPHEWQDIRNNGEYIQYLKKISKQIPILLFNTGDVSPPINLTNSIQVRTFLHPGENHNDKVIIPYPAKGREFRLRNWTKIPKVGFMGQVPRISPGSLISRPAPSLIHPIKSSVYLNRKIAVAKLGNLKLNIKTEVVIRPMFSAHQKNLNFSSHSVEFQDQLFNCDYILCPRGYGNTSIRFYETLSAGRTPILIESNGGLPELNTNRDWQDHIISAGLLENWSKLILRDWAFLSKNQNYSNRQLANADLFDSLLYFEKYMEKLFLGYIKIEA
jgi:hypothetical protein